MHIYVVASLACLWHDNFSTSSNLQIANRLVAPGLVLDGSILIAHNVGHLDAEGCIGHIIGIGIQFESKSVGFRQHTIVAIVAQRIAHELSTLHEIVSIVIGVVAIYQ